MVSRDSAVLWLGAIGALLTYLIAADAPPTEWTYGQWLQAGAFIVAWGSGKLATSPLPGASDADKVSRVPGWLLPIALVAGLSAACGGGKAIVHPAPPVESVQQVRAKAIEIAAAVEAAGGLVVEARRATGAAYTAGLITRAQRDVVYQAIIELEPRALAVIAIAETVTTDPQLRSTVQALSQALQPLFATLEAGSPAMATVGASLRTALAVLTAYLGGGL